MRKKAKSNAVVHLQPFNFELPLDPLIDLLKSNYSEGEIVDPNYLHWEYLENPSGAPITVVAKDEEGDLIGQYLVIPSGLIVDGEKIGGSLSLNTLTRSDYRGRGLFTKMALATLDICKENNTKVTYGFPNPNSYPGFVRNLNFTHIGNAPIFFKPLNYWQILYKKVIKKSKEKYGRDLLTKHNELRLEYSSKDFEISSFSLDTDRMLYEAFWEKFKCVYPVMIDRGIEHLLWRYIKVPTRNYQLIKMVKDGRMLGYCVIRAREVYGLNSGFLIDFCVLPGKEAQKGAKEMLKVVSRHFKKHRIDLIGCMMSQDTNEYKILKQCGFISIPKRFLPHNNPVIVRINDEFDGSANLLKKESWFLTFGDYDVM